MTVRAVTAGGVSFGAEASARGRLPALQVDTIDGLLGAAVAPAKPNGAAVPVRSSRDYGHPTKASAGQVDEAHAGILVEVL
jgi:hypothetical protein